MIEIHRVTFARTLATNEHFVNECDGEVIVVDDVGGWLIGDQPFSILTPFEFIRNTF